MKGLLPCPQSNLHLLVRRGAHSSFLVEDSWLRKRARRWEHAEAPLPLGPLALLKLLESGRVRFWSNYKHA